ncbi:MAG: hypothetical protein DI539_17720 [Flavobacterium psychrophilum]|nr:MAG: hypothetical protein DI539_17720 [Flavobacterium psychrophilum]
MKIKILFIFLFFWNLSTAQKGLDTIAVFTATFKTGSYTITPEQRVRVKYFCEKLTGEIGIIGYSDTTGTSQLNDTLSIRRARALRDCIHEFFPDLKINTYIGERNQWHIKLPPEQQRSAFVVIGTSWIDYNFEEALKFCSEDICILPHHLGSQSDYPEDYNPGINIRTFSTPAHRISAGINTIDDKNTVLMIAGVAYICIDTKPGVWQGGTVVVPFKGPIEPDLKVYQKNKDNVWKETDILVTAFDGKNYAFTIPQESGCLSFCLGKPAKIKRQKNGDIQANSYKTVYIGTHKSFNFKDVNVVGKQNSLSYSAKLNDSLMAFTLPAHLSAKQMVFNGLYDENGSEKILTVSLAKCKYSKDKDGNDNYLITEESLINKAPVKKKKGFWQWLKDLF